MIPTQKQIPLLQVIKEAVARSNAPFHTPGHKRGQGISPALAALMGDAVFQADLPELPELDNLFSPQGAIQDAQALAAEAFGADQTYFLVNGSTCGIEAAVLAVCHPSEKIILPRNSHQSAIAALILSGAVPIFVNPEYDSKWGIAHSITPKAVAQSLEQHPDAKAVMMVSPTYYGVCGDVEAIAHLAHQRSIPLIVDEAHGPHFAFHPELPKSALEQGADMVVQSTHKVLGAMTQAAMLHVKSPRVNGDRLAKALQLVQSTSPSYILLASLDAARQQVALQGYELMTHALALANQARDRLSHTLKLKVLGAEAIGTPGCMAIDRTRLTVDVSTLGMTGFEADEILHRELGVTAELPALGHLTFIVSFGNRQADVDRLVRGFEQLQSIPFPRSKGSCKNFLDCIPAVVSAMTPRSAFFSATETIPAEMAIDRISAELVCPYPPGIPLLIPGEKIGAEALETVQQVLQSGGIVTGCADYTFHTLKVVVP